MITQIHTGTQVKTFKCICMCQKYIILLQRMKCNIVIILAYRSFQPSTKKMCESLFSQPSWSSASMTSKLLPTKSNYCYMSLLPCLRPVFLLIFFLKHSCRSTPCSLIGVRRQGIAAFPPQCRKARWSEGGGMSPRDKTQETVWECHKAGYHGALWLGDFSAAPWEILQYTQEQREKAGYLCANITPVLTTASDEPE